MPDWDTTGSKMKAIEIKKKANQWEEKEREKQEVEEMKKLSFIVGRN